MSNNLLSNNIVLDAIMRYRRVLVDVDPISAIHF
jgi:hypothetical protein